MYVLLTCDGDDNPSVMLWRSEAALRSFLAADAGFALSKYAVEALMNGYDEAVDNVILRVRHIHPQED